MYIKEIGQLRPPTRPGQPSSQNREISPDLQIAPVTVDEIFATLPVCYEIGLRLVTVLVKGNIAMFFIYRA